MIRNKRTVKKKSHYLWIPLNKKTVVYQLFFYLFLYNRGRLTREHFCPFYFTLCMLLPYQ